MFFLWFSSHSFLLLFCFCPRQTYRMSTLLETYCKLENVPLKDCIMKQDGREVVRRINFLAGRLGCVVGFSRRKPLLSRAFSVSFGESGCLSAGDRKGFVASM